MARSGRKPSRGTGGVQLGGRHWGSAEIAAIRRLIRSHREANRSELSVLVCQAWNWRRPNGALRVRTCRDLLVRLHESGQINLPQSQQGVRPEREGPPRKSGSHWLSVPSPLGKEDVALRSVVVRPIRREEEARWREAVARFHYLGDGKAVGETIRYVAESQGRWLALASWAAAVLKSRHRERYVGWEEKIKYQRLHLVANNVRFLILPWIRIPHLASKVLAANLRRLSADWEARYGHPILLAETFVDSSRFRGTCYRASNWIYLGQTRGVGRKGAGFQHHGRPKSLFVYPVHRRAKELLSAPFPSPEIQGRDFMQTKPIDVNQLPLEGRGGLIELLREITDPRKARGIRHPLPSVLALAVMAVLSGMRSYEAIAEWAADLPKELLRRLRCWCWRAPSEPTFRRVLQSVRVEEIDQKVGQWLAKQDGLRGMGIAIDGKALRGSGDGESPAFHLLAAVTHETGIVIAQERVDDKTNEITHAQPLLENLDLKGMTITADAMHTQKKLADFIVKDQGGHYVLIAKDNQPTLLEDIKTLEWDTFSPSGHHARQGTRPDRNPHDLGE